MLVGLGMLFALFIVVLIMPPADKPKSPDVKYTKKVEYYIDKGKEHINLDD